MTGVIQSPDTVAVGTCEHCGEVVVERPLDKKDLGADVNQEIADRYTRNHAWNCSERTDPGGYELVLESAAPRGESS